MSSVEHLARTLELHFNDQKMLELALTHKSYPGESYERLEFLGDTVLDLVISANLYKRFPNANEGQLSRMRSELVKQSTLAAVGRKLFLNDHVRLGEGELKSGGFNRDSILADLVESIIGALYLDQGFAVTGAFVERIFKKKISLLKVDQGYKDSKSLLQEQLQESGGALPEYWIKSVSGAQHDQQFTVICRLPDIDTEFIGRDSSRRKAEQSAATSALASLTDN